LSERGYRVLRFWNDAVLTNMDGVLEQIVAAPEREDSKTRYFQCGMNARQRLCGYCPHPRAPGALALSLDRERDSKSRERENATRSATEPGLRAEPLGEAQKSLRRAHNERSERLKCRSAIAWILPSPARARRACPLPGQGEGSIELC
jgi:hypothetical protein